MPESEVRFMVRHLFAGEDGRDVVARLDRRVDRLPGWPAWALRSAASRHSA